MTGKATKEHEDEMSLSLKMHKRWVNCGQEDAHGHRKHPTSLLYSSDD